MEYFQRSVKPVKIDYDDLDFNAPSPTKWNVSFKDISIPWLDELTPHVDTKYYDKQISIPLVDFEPTHTRLLQPPDEDVFESLHLVYGLPKPNLNTELAEKYIYHSKNIDVSKTFRRSALNESNNTNPDLPPDDDPEQMNQMQQYMIEYANNYEVGDDIETGHANNNSTENVIVPPQRQRRNIDEMELPPPFANIPTRNQSNRDDVLNINPVSENSTKPFLTPNKHKLPKLPKKEHSTRYASKVDELANNAVKRVESNLLSDEAITKIIKDIHKQDKEKKLIS